MMHPARQAYVEEEPQVRSLPQVHSRVFFYLQLASRPEPIGARFICTNGRLTDMDEKQDVDMGVDLASIRRKSLASVQTSLPLTLDQPLTETMKCQQVPVGLPPKRHLPSYRNSTENEDSPNWPFPRTTGK